MATEFKLPELGENINSGDVVSILVNEGDVVKANQGIMEVETGKAVVEVPVSQAGRITKIHVQKGQSVAVGAVLVTLEAEAGAATEGKTSKAAPAAAKATEGKPAEKKEGDGKAKESKGAQRKGEAAQPVTTKEEPTPRKTGDQPAPHLNGGAAKAQPVVDDEPAGVAAPAGPATRRLARELGVDLRHVNGTGTGGRITREDVVSAVRNSNAGGGRTAQKSRKPVEGEGVAAQDKWGPIRRQPMSRIRKAIAENMGRSTVIPHVTNFDDADITDLEGIRKGSMANSVGSEVKLTMTAFVLKAVAQSLKLHPLINASLDLDGEQVVYKDYVNLGVAVDSERGLIVPVMRDVDQLSIPQIAESLNDLANRVRGSKFTLEDTQGATFTVSNLGAIGGTYSTPIINAPEVAILLLGRSRQLPVWQEDKFVPRLMMPLSLSYDHRLVDGANAARFLNEIKSFLQSPGRLLLAS